MANHIGGSPVRGEGRQVVVYGAPFVGKTTTLADPNIKVLLCDMDHNTSPLDDADNVTIFPVDSFETDPEQAKLTGIDNSYMEFKRSVMRGYFLVNKEKIPCTDYDVIAFDSFTRFEELIKKWVANTYAPKRAREISGKFGAQTDWDDLQSREVQEIRDWQAMTRSYGFNVIWLGHDMTINNDVTKKAQRIQLALQGKYASPRITSAVDALFYMSKESIDDKDNPGKQKLVRGIYTQQFDIVQADARMSVEKRVKLPAYIPHVEWSKILPYLGWTKKK